MKLPITHTVASKLKLARSSKGWSLDKASQQCNVSKAMLGQIERQESSPTIARLWNIATGFELPLSYFFTETVEEQKNNDESIKISTLFAFDEQTKMEVFSLTLQSHHEHLSTAHNSGIIEHIVVIDGEMECLIEGEWHKVKQGETLKFNADQAHGYRNLSSLPCTFHNIINYTMNVKQ